MVSKPIVVNFYCLDHNTKNRRVQGFKNYSKIVCYSRKGKDCIANARLELVRSLYHLSLEPTAPYSSMILIYNHYSGFGPESSGCVIDLEKDVLLVLLHKSYVLAISI